MIYIYTYTYARAYTTQQRVQKIRKDVLAGKPISNMILYEKAQGSNKRIAVSPLRKAANKWELMYPYVYVSRIHRTYAYQI
jgi:hypothetical protein